MKQAVLVLILLAVTAPWAAADVKKGTYVGTSSTSVTYYDSAMKAVAVDGFSCKETVVIGAPKKVGRAVESNPFSLKILATKPRVPRADGDVKIGSARILPAHGGGSELVQYWQLQNTDTGFIGALTDNHLADGFDYDHVIAKIRGTPLPPIFFFRTFSADTNNVGVIGLQPIPPVPSASFSLHDASVSAGQQCTLTATVTGRKLELTISGYAFLPGQSAYIWFSTRIDARRYANP